MIAVVSMDDSAQRGGKLGEESRIRFVQKDVNMTSGREGVCKYDVFFAKLSDFDQYASNFSKPPCRFEILLYPDSSTSVCDLVTLFPKF